MKRLSLLFLMLLFALGAKAAMVFDASQPPNNTTTRYKKDVKGDNGDYIVMQIVSAIKTHKCASSDDIEFNPEESLAHKEIDAPFIKWEGNKNSCLLIPGKKALNIYYTGAGTAYVSYAYDGDASINISKVDVGGYSYSIIKNNSSSGNIYLYEIAFKQSHHKHQYIKDSIQAKGNTLRAACYCGDTITTTLKAGDKTYDGDSYNYNYITWEKGDIWNSSITDTFYRTTSFAYEFSANGPSSTLSPVNAGKYKVTASRNDISVTDSFEITKAKYAKVILDNLTIDTIPCSEENAGYLMIKNPPYTLGYQFNGSDSSLCETTGSFKIDSSSKRVEIKMWYKEDSNHIRSDDTLLTFEMPHKYDSMGYDSIYHWEQCIYRGHDSIRKNSLPHEYGHYPNEGESVFCCDNCNYEDSCRKVLKKDIDSCTLNFISTDASGTLENAINSAANILNMGNQDPSKNASHELIKKEINNLKLAIDTAKKLDSIFINLRDSLGIKINELEKDTLGTISYDSQKNYWRNLEARNTLIKAIGDADTPNTAKYDTARTDSIKGMNDGITRLDSVVSMAYQLEHNFQDSLKVLKEWIDSAIKDTSRWTNKEAKDLLKTALAHDTIIYQTDSTQANVNKAIHSLRDTISLGEKIENRYWNLRNSLRDTIDKAKTDSGIYHSKRPPCKDAVDTLGRAIKLSVLDSSATDTSTIYEAVHRLNSAITQALKDTLQFYKTREGLKKDTAYANSLLANLTEEYRNKLDTIILNADTALQIDSTIALIREDSLKFKNSLDTIIRLNTLANLSNEINKATEDSVKMINKEAVDTIHIALDSARKVFNTYQTENINEEVVNGTTLYLKKVDSIAKKWDTLFRVSYTPLCKLIVSVTLDSLGNNEGISWRNDTARAKLQKALGDTSTQFTAQYDSAHTRDTAGIRVALKRFKDSIQSAREFEIIYRTYRKSLSDTIDSANTLISEFRGKEAKDTLIQVKDSSKKIYDNDSNTVRTSSAIHALYSTMEYAIHLNDSFIEIDTILGDSIISAEKDTIILVNREAKDTLTNILTYTKNKRGKDSIIETRYRLIDTLNTIREYAYSLNLYFIYLRDSVLGGNIFTADTTLDNLKCKEAYDTLQIAILNARNDSLNIRDTSHIKGASDTIISVTFFADSLENIHTYWRDFLKKKMDHVSDSNFYENQDAKDTLKDVIQLAQRKYDSIFTTQSVKSSIGTLNTITLVADSLNRYFLWLRDDSLKERINATDSMFKTLRCKEARDTLTYAINSAREDSANKKYIQEINNAISLLYSATYYGDSINKGFIDSLNVLSGLITKAKTLASQITESKSRNELEKVITFADNTYNQDSTKGGVDTTIIMVRNAIVSSDYDDVRNKLQTTINVANILIIETFQTPQAKNFLSEAVDTAKKYLNSSKELIETATKTLIQKMSEARDLEAEFKNAVLFLKGTIAEAERVDSILVDENKRKELQAEIAIAKNILETERNRDRIEEENDRLIDAIVRAKEDLVKIVQLFPQMLIVDNHYKIFVSYQWFCNHKEIEGATGQSYYNAEGLSGDYQVFVKDKEGYTYYSEIWSSSQSKAPKKTQKTFLKGEAVIITEDNYIIHLDGTTEGGKRYEE